MAGARKSQVGRRRQGVYAPYPSTQSRHQPDERKASGWCGGPECPRPRRKNLFVSDGSQFTTGAAENPTLTIVALALRQADHISSEMGKGNP
jgi:hypothetical protein